MTMSPQEFINDTTLTQTSPGVYQATTQFGGETYTQTVNTNSSDSLALTGFTPSQSMPANASSSQTISTGNIPLILPTPGTAGQSPAPQIVPSNQGYTVGMSGLSTPQQLGINTNTTQASSFELPNIPFTYHSITPNTVQASSNNAPWYTYIPSDVASTIGNLVNWSVTPPGYTPGGAPLAGGQFPYNYPFTQEDINKLALTNPTLAKNIQNQYNQLSYLSGHALQETIPNIGYEYLGLPSQSGDVLNYITSPAGEAKIGAEIGIPLGAGSIIAAAPLAAASATSTAPSSAGINTGTNLPNVGYSTFGNNSTVHWVNVHDGTYYVEVNLPNGQKFQYGSTDSPMQVLEVPFGTILATDQAVDQAWQAYLNAQSSLQNVPSNSNIKVVQGTNGLDININTAGTSTAPTQTVEVAPGLTFTYPSYTVAPPPFPGSTQVINVPIPTINNKAT
ncbi:MAG: hypothetical protein M1538_00485, partial [Candidatus Marsarchaeota archaeon]|nr:hypothetical protein [Candidatus Marsarchaeota archaeon]